ncbi:hypothetical protein ACFW1P_04480 [Paenibacillus sp. NPDC058910]
MLRSWDTGKPFLSFRYQNTVSITGGVLLRFDPAFLLASNGSTD